MGQLFPHLVVVKTQEHGTPTTATGGEGGGGGVKPNNKERCCGYGIQFPTPRNTPSATAQTNQNHTREAIIV